jgi:hypothetical protein
MLEATKQPDLEQFVSALQKDYSKLSIRLRELTHSVKCNCNGVQLRLHFPAINQGKAGVHPV